MKPRHVLALCGAILAVVLVPAAIALASTKVTVRVEGAARTLLAATSVSVPGSGSITKGGAPSGACPRSSAAGALDGATGHRWTGKYYPSVAGIFINSIFGEKPTGNFYWTVFVNDRSSALGICALKLHRGDQLLFAVTSGSQAPIVLTGPSRLRVGRTAIVSTGYYSAGRLKPLAGVRVHGGGVSVVSDRHGRVRIPITRSGTLVLRADEHGYIRAAPLRLRELP